MARETPPTIFGGKKKKKGKRKITISSPQPVLHFPRGYVRTARGVRGKQPMAICFWQAE